MEAVRVHMTWRLFQLHMASPGVRVKESLTQTSSTHKIISLLGYFLNELCDLAFTLVTTLLRAKTDQIVDLKCCGFWLQSSILDNFTFKCIVTTDL